MTDKIDTIRDDLAFMKAMASGDGRLLGVAGGHFFAAGVIYGLPLIAVWATLRGYLDLPLGLTSWASIYSTGVYLPVMGWLFLKDKGKVTPSAATRAFASLWGGVGATTIVMLIVIFTAGARLHVHEMWQVWTAICFTIYGAAWLGIAIVRRSPGWALVAAGSYLTAIANSFLIGGPDVLLGCAIGILLWLALPGLVMMRLSPRGA